VSDSELRYRLSPSATWQITGAQAEVFAQGKTMRVPLRLFQLLLELVEPNTAAALHPRVAGEVSLADMEAACARLADHGILLRVEAGQPEPPAAPPFRALLREDFFAGELGDAVSAALIGGRAVIIQDAFRPEIAERVHRDLEACTAWTPYEHIDTRFHYHHHNLYLEATFPPSMHELQASFASHETRALVGQLARRDCGGRVMFGASLYLPGDHSLPHRDHGFSRNVAFVWHLCRDWEPRWGGSLYWCPSGTAVAPSFNTLVLFNVTESSLHFVTAVSPHARGRRYAVNGWWTGVVEPAAPPPPRPGPLPIVADPLYGAPHVVLPGDGRVRAI
jgi:hypothetical protein